ncbi:hypothetical protein BAUCODRAFT_35729 [Baudoinia panamericana UAMH 10762]|uniref:Major facilitator superfamily (MFS) profile domain-containing protein n=1 Tax=Baudoinia panamericana (strain UAMH 10762) TaxID=717646 RepID=M2MDC9_BAUPA|nr:uncharacterized protein BAUCODRAFT_35729 [Baudoinia panamericana UAMH 10762]EMC94511.1 hypothetical protein BAUCODRAFT_35729 [Baudoinia panamericana UAMH 10762]
MGDLVPNLAPKFSDQFAHLSDPEVDKLEQDKSPKLDSSSSSLDDGRIGPETEILWHYLTFETELPPPADVRQLTVPSSEQPRPEGPNLVKYTSPFLWSETRKSLLTWLSVVCTTFTAYTAGSYEAAVPQMTELWHVSDVAASVGITIFTCGFAVAPMVLAPFSEINGRQPMFVVTGVLFVIFQIVCAVTPSYAGMIVARFLVGCAGSTFSTMVGGVVSDIYHAEDRNTAMALFSGAALLGTGLGPLVSGFIAQHTTWRWVFYLQVVVDGVLMVFIVLFFQETRGSVLLSRKAKAVNKWYEQLENAGYFGVMMPAGPGLEKKIAPQRIRWKVKSDEERASLGRMITISLYRPFHLLLTEPVVFFFSLWISFSWAVLYLLIAAIPLVFQTNHGFSLEQADAVFTAVSVAAIISTVISIYQEKLARRILSPERCVVLDSPEGRLYFACVQSALLPIGCFWFGWTSFPSIPWIVPALATGCATMGIFSIYLAVFNYLADTYHRYASSALAAQSFCRNMLGGAFPLFTRQMFTKLTYQGAGSFLGGFSALLTVVPCVLFLYGPKIRARSKFASEIMKGSSGE